MAGHRRASSKHQSPSPLHGLCGTLIGWTSWKSLSVCMTSLPSHYSPTHATDRFVKILLVWGVGWEKSNTMSLTAFWLTSETLHLSVVYVCVKEREHRSRGLSHIRRCHGSCFPQSSVSGEISKTNNYSSLPLLTTSTSILSKQNLTTVSPL